MVFLITCKSDEEPIKNEITIIWTTFSLVYEALKGGYPKSVRPLRVGNSHANSQKWAKIEHLRDFMPVLIICKFDEDLIKN